MLFQIWVGRELFLANETLIHLYAEVSELVALKVPFGGADFPTVVAWPCLSRRLHDNIKWIDRNISLKSSVVRFWVSSAHQKSSPQPLVQFASHSDRFSFGVVSSWSQERKSFRSIHTDISWQNPLGGLFFDVGQDSTSSNRPANSIPHFTTRHGCSLSSGAVSSVSNIRTFRSCYQRRITLLQSLQIYCWRHIGGISDKLTLPPSTSQVSDPSALLFTDACIVESAMMSAGKTFSSVYNSDNCRDRGALGNRHPKKHIREEETTT